MRDNFSDVWWLYSPIYCRIGTGASGRTCICCIFFAVGLWKTIVVSADLGLLGILFSSFRTVSWEMVCLTTSVTSPLLSLRVLIWQLTFYSSSRRNKHIRRYFPFIQRLTCIRGSGRSLKWQVNSEIPGWKSNGTGISRKYFSKLWVHLTRLSSFSEFMQIQNFLLSAS